MEKEFSHKYHKLYLSYLTYEYFLNKSANNYNQYADELKLSANEAMALFVDKKYEILKDVMFFHNKEKLSYVDLIMKKDLEILVALVIEISVKSGKLSWLFEEVGTYAINKFVDFGVASIAKEISNQMDIRNYLISIKERDILIRELSDSQQDKNETKKI